MVIILAAHLTNSSNSLCIGGTNPLISGNFLTQRVLIDGTVVITGDLYVSGTIFEGDNAGDDGFDSIDEIASGIKQSRSSKQALEMSQIKVASSDQSHKTQDSIQ